VRDVVFKIIICLTLKQQLHNISNMDWDDDLYYFLFHHVASWAKYYDMNFFYNGLDLLCSSNGLFV
jgi:hypothetical protein